ncbi:MAG: PIN domain nuclease [Actinobacteria bacterium]|nr:PIN domain nuclease [Actinomycetota bacterium]
MAYLADTSAWHRSGRVDEQWETLLDADEIAICVPVSLELLYSSRGRRDYHTLASDLQRLPYLPLDENAARFALQTQERLADRSQHRGPSPVDILIAAIAAVHDAIVLHYDRHFDAIQRVTGQPMEWLMRRGSVP